MEELKVKPHVIISEHTLSENGAQTLGGINNVRVSLELTLEGAGTSKMTIWASRPTYPGQSDARQGLRNAASFLKMKKDANEVVELTVSYIGYHSIAPLWSNMIFSDHRRSETHSYLPKEIILPPQELGSVNSMVLERLLHSSHDKLELITMRRDIRLSGKWHEYSVLLRATNKGNS